VECDKEELNVEDAHFIDDLLNQRVKYRIFGLPQLLPLFSLKTNILIVSNFYEIECRFIFLLLFFTLELDLRSGIRRRLIILILRVILRIRLSVWRGIIWSAILHWRVIGLLRIHGLTYVLGSDHSNWIRGRSLAVRWLWIRLGIYVLVLLLEEWVGNRACLRG
jgi:hypothetical protein